MDGVSRMLLVSGGFSLGVVVVTLLLNLIRVRWVKYIPTGLLASLALAGFLQAKFALFGPNGEMRDLAAMVGAIMAGIMTFVGIVTCIVLEFIAKQKRP